MDPVFRNALCMPLSDYINEKEGSLCQMEVIVVCWSSIHFLHVVSDLSIPSPTSALMESNSHMSKFLKKCGFIKNEK
jgi:hypothetical protein